MASPRLGGTRCTLSVHVGPRARRVLNNPEAPSLLSVRLSLVQLPQFGDRLTADASTSTPPVGCLAIAAPRPRRHHQVREPHQNQRRERVAPAGLDVSVEVPALVRGQLSNTIAFGYHRVGPGHVDTELVPSISARASHPRPRRRWFEFARCATHVQPVRPRSHRCGRWRSTGSRAPRRESSPAPSLRCSAAIAAQLPNLEFWSPRARPSTAPESR